MEEIFYKFEIENIKDKEYKKVYINCPWESKRNEYYLNENEHFEWLKSTNLLKDDELFEFFKGKTYIMSSYINPLNPKENLIWAIRMHDFIYIVDDYYFEKGLLGEEWVNNLFERDAPQDSIGIEFWKIIEGIEKTGNKNAIKYLLEYTKEFALSVFLYNKSKINSNSTFEEYCKYRCLDVGMNFGLATANNFIEPLPQIVLDDPIYKDIIYKYNQSHSLINDITSFEREVRESKRMANYVMVHAHQSGSIQTSMLHCKKLVEDIMSEISILCDQLKSIYSNVDNIDLHLRIIKLVISGDNYVSNDVTYPRYNNFN